jgi:hypothetical protein
LTRCSNCARELPEGALYCPDCGVTTADLAAQPGFSPSHFNAGMTSTAAPLATTPAPEEGGFAVPPAPSPAPEEAVRPKSGGGRRVLLAVIAILAVLLVAASFESGLLPTGAGAAPTVNSPATPVTGEQLYAAYGANQASADASYTNKTVYIQDSLDFGVSRDLSNGQYFSSVNFGTVILVWSPQTQVGQLYPGATVLAKCSVQGLIFSLGSGYLLYLQDCSLVSVQAQTATTSSASVQGASL